MKLKSLITFSLLFVLSFSIVHEYIFAMFEDEHCSVGEYVCELEIPSDHGDLCDIHFEYHQSFLLSDITKIPNIEDYKSLNLFKDKIYTFKTHRELFRPPIV